MNYFRLNPLSQPLLLTMNKSKIINIKIFTTRWLTATFSITNAKTTIVNTTSKINNMFIIDNFKTQDKHKYYA